MMDFLAPLFLAGAAAVALPILFHLIRKTTNEKTVFSSLMFLMPTPPKVTRRSRLENILLLIMRCGVLCLLALGFARPYLLRPSAAGGPIGPGKKVVILVDTSASMRRDGLWDQARERVRDSLEKLGPADEAALFAFDDQASQLVSMEEWRRAQVRERPAIAMARFETLTPTWRGTHLGGALLRAVDVLEEASAAGVERGARDIAREIVVISDLQQGSHLDGLQGFEWPKGLTVRVEALKARRPSNAGIHMVGERDDLGPTAELNQRVRIVNSANSRKEQFKVAWVGGTNAPLEAYVPPGQSRILRLPALPENQKRGELTLTGDEEAFDNRLFWVATRQAHVNVAYLGTEAETDTTQPLFYLKRAFQQTVRQDVRITNQPGPDTSLYIITGEEARVEPRPRQSAREGTVPRAPTLLVVMKSTAAARMISQLLNLPQVSCEEASGQKYSLLADIDFTHPLFKPFADPRFSDFTKIHFWKHRRLDAQQIPGARVLARFDQGDPALIEAPSEKGRLLILTSSWNPTDSQLALSSKFVPLLYSILEWEGERPREPANLQFEIGQTLPPELRTAQGAESPGIYSAGVINFAVNLPSAESRTAPMTIDELEQLGVPAKITSRSQIEISKSKTRDSFQATEAENQQKLWRWLILGALAFLICETFMAARTTGLTSAISPSPPEPRS